MPPVAAVIGAITISSILASVATAAISFAATYVIGALTQSNSGQDSAATATDAHTVTLKQPLTHPGRPSMGTPGSAGSMSTSILQGQSAEGIRHHQMPR